MNDRNKEVAFIRNPINSNGPICLVKRHSKTLAMANLLGTFKIFTYERSSTNAGSPWQLKNLSKRASDCHRAYNEQMTQEAKHLRNLQAPNIPSVMVLGTFDHELHKTQLSTITLADKLSQRYNLVMGPMKVQVATKVVVAVLETLDYLHEKCGMIHGDISSFNIQIEENYKSIKVCGFGKHSMKLSSDGWKDFSSDNVTVGLWSAPEVLRHATNVSPKSDIFSLGLVVYEMLACMPPHTFPGIQDSSILEAVELRDCHLQYKREKVGVRTMVRRHQPTVMPKRKQKPYARMSTAPFVPRSPKIVYYDCEDEQECLSSKILTARLVASLKHGTSGYGTQLSIEITGEMPLVPLIPQEPMPSPPTTPSDEDEDDSDAMSEFSDITSESTHSDICASTGIPIPRDNHLNYSCLGTRPIIPNLQTLDSKYDTLLGLFYLCTEMDPDDRPTAGRLLRALSDEKTTQKAGS
uniref:Protein kinase domain-containing protein n=1 Tax=Anopheles culicifacies TaxID=139723 RepID=A0A182M5W9_9DIPT